MLNRNFPKLANRSAALTCLLAITLVLAGSPHAAAQTPSTQHEGISGSSEALVRLSAHTAAQVQNGSAVQLAHYDPEQKLRLAVVLVLPHPAEEKQFLEDIQDKKSPLFHQFLSPEEWNTRFGPTAESEQAVVDWAQSQGLTVTHRYNNRLVVDLEAPVGTIEKALNLKINTYQLPATVGREARTVYSNDSDPSVPAHLAGVVDAVLGLNSIVAVRPNGGSGRLASVPDYSPGPVVQEAGSLHKDAPAPVQSASAAGALPTAGTSTPNGYTPQYFWNSDAYNYQALMNQGHCCNPLNNSSGHSPRESSIAVASFADVSFDDLNAFQAYFSNLALYVDKYNIDGTYVCNNSPNPDDGCSEVTMDTEWSLATANSQGSSADTARVVVYEGDGYNNAVIMDLYTQMEADAHARTMTTSWGVEENIQFSSNPEMDTYNTTMQSVDKIFSQMAGEGWTLVAATGDQGATAGCTAALAVQFPSSDPNVVGAGGTELSEGNPYEVAWTGGTNPGNPNANPPTSDSCGSNGGGSTGGFSEYWPAPSYQSPLGFSKRAVPDLALDTTHGHDVYFDGSWIHPGGTSVAAPMLAGFFAQANAYLLSIGSICGSGTSACAPIGNANYPIYAEGTHPNAAHSPFYDITQGCNSNDITVNPSNHLTPYCAGPGYDEVTGWGSANMLQLAWAINWEVIPASGEPYITWDGPATNKWYNTNQTVNWTIHDWEPSGSTPGTGIAGETQGWDSIPSDPRSEQHGGSGNSFWDGPQFPNGSTGCLAFEPNGCSGGVSQGCHTAWARGWNNQGWNTSGNSGYPESYGPLCYDTVPPQLYVNDSPEYPNSSGWYTGPVNLTLGATDPGGSAASGVANIFYGINNSSCGTGNAGACAIYSSGLNLTTQGTQNVIAFAEDKAGNFDQPFTQAFSIDYTPPVTTAGFNGVLNASAWKNSVTIVLKATDNASGVAATYYTVDGGTTTLYGGSFTISTVGTHTLDYWSVDVAGNTEKGNVDTFQVASATTSTLTSSPNPSVSGTAVTLKATVAGTDAGTPTGTVSFTSGSTQLGTVTLSGGSATLTTSKLPIGSDVVYFIFSGTANWLNSASAGVTQAVLQTTTTTLTATPNPAVYGSTVALSAKVSSSVSGTPTGLVNFYNGSTFIGYASLNSSGVASFPIATLAGGANSITASYAGDSNYAGSNSAVLKETINKASSATALTSSTNSSSYGESVTFTATVTSSGGTPTGNVTFYANSSSLGSGSIVDGVAKFTTSTIPLGSYTITSTYGGSADFSGSSSSAVTLVTGAATTTTTVVSSLNPSDFGEWVTFTATVTPATSGAPGGTVTFLANGTSIGTGNLSNGVATFATYQLPLGTSSITAAYSGSTDYKANASTAVSEAIDVEPTATVLTSSQNPSAYDESVTFTATVTSASAVKPTGTVTFQVNGTNVGTETLANGAATYQTTALTVGTNLITASYAGTAEYKASASGSLSEVTHADDTTTTLKSAPLLSAYGESVTLTATVKSATAGEPTGKVVFLADGNSIGTGTISGGDAILKTTALALGTHSLVAIYEGTLDFKTSTSTAVSQVIVVADTTTTLTSSLNPAAYDQPVTFTATVKSVSGGTPAGKVTFLANGTSMGTATLASGVATMKTTALPVGTSSITASYAGTDDYKASTSTAVSQVIHAESTTTVLTSSVNPSAHGQSVTFTAKVTSSVAGTPTGSVVFQSNGTSIGTAALSNGSTVLTTSSLAAGTNSIKATYVGDTDFQTSTSAALSEVTK
jgi:hypothetical protein